MGKFRVLQFDRAVVEWLRFGVKNGTNQTAPIIDLFLDGRYNEEEIIKQLLPQKLKNQYTFKTQEAIGLLHFRKVIQV